MRSSIGASGAIFGLMGAFVIFARARGISIMQSGIGPVILLNLAITFTIPGISKGGHIGGLIGGAAIAGAHASRSTSAGASRVAARLPIVAISVAAFAALLVVSFAAGALEVPSVG